MFPVKEIISLTWNPTISVIIPTLEEEKLLARTLEQFTPDIRAYHRLEIIVSDGGSKDNTLCIARRHADHVVEAGVGTRQNISMGRNRGAEAAQGEILVFFNADTLIDNPDRFFSTMVRVLRDNRISAATCDVLVYPEGETFADRFFHGSYNRYFWLLNVLGMGMGRGECHVVKRELFERIGGYNESIAAGEDFELFLRLRRLGKIAFIRSLRVFESPRRYRTYGYFRISLLWFLNALSVFLFRRSMLDEWKPVR